MQPVTMQPIITPFFFSGPFLPEPGRIRPGPSQPRRPPAWAPGPKTWAWAGVRRLPRGLVSPRRERADPSRPSDRTAEIAPARDKTGARLPPARNPSPILSSSLSLSHTRGDRERDDDDGETAHSRSGDGAAEPCSPGLRAAIVGAHPRRALLDGALMHPPHARGTSAAATTRWGRRRQAGTASTRGGAGPARRVATREATRGPSPRARARLFTASVATRWSLPATMALR